VTNELNIGPTAAIVTIGDEIVEGRVLNQNAAWLSEALMAQGIWPRLVVAVPDDQQLIVRVLHIAADSADLLFVCGGLGFTPDDITRTSVAAAFYRDVAVHSATQRAFVDANAWANDDIAAAVASIPIDAEPIPSPVGGVPGFKLRGTYVLSGAPSEMQAMFKSLSFHVTTSPIHRVVIELATTEDQIASTLGEFERQHPQVRLGSYPDLASEPPALTIVLVSRSAKHIEQAARWMQSRLAASVKQI
jgi:molybdenum cofactor synthesis domain-containing protein